MLRINRIRKDLKHSEKETKAAGSRKEEAKEVKSRFLSNMSHAAIRDPNQHIHFQTNISQHIVHTDCNKIMEMPVVAFYCHFWTSHEKRNILFTLDKTDEALCFGITNSPLADKQCTGQGAFMRHEINRLLLKHFSGTYQVLSDAQEGPTILFTCPAVITE